MPRLIVLQGPDRGQIHDVGHTVTIGRLSSNDIQLRDEQASREHARLEVNGHEVVVVDLGSSKGLEVNGRRVSRQRLEHGDSLTIGVSVLRFEAARDGAPPPLPEGDPGRTLVAMEGSAAGADGGVGFRVNVAGEAPSVGSPPPSRRPTARPASDVVRGAAPGTVPRRASSRPGSDVLKGGLPGTAPRRASARPVAASVGGEAPAEPRRTRLEEARATGGTSWIEFVLGTAILVGVFFAAKWVGEEAVRRVLKPLPAPEEDPSK